MSDRLRQRASQKNRARGLLFEPDLAGAPHAKVRVWVRTWGEIVEDAKRRLSYFQDQLQHDPSFDEARDYLRRHHGNVIPEALLVVNKDEREGEAVLKGVPDHQVGDQAPSSTSAEERLT